jgi:hypothetical protein
MPRNQKENNEVDEGVKQEAVSFVDVLAGKEIDIRGQVESHSRDIEEIKSDLTKERQNNITVFGIFASLVTFFSIEIQIFKNIENFWLLIGLTSFLVSAMLMFTMSLGYIARGETKWGNFFKSPIFLLFIIFLIFSFLIFLFNGKGINIDIKVKN